jgi:hypothetical protein
MRVKVERFFRRTLRLKGMGIRLLTIRSDYADYTLHSIKTPTEADALAL